MYSEVIDNSNIIKAVEQVNDENLLDLNILSVSPGIILYISYLFLYFLNLITKLNLEILSL